MQNRKHGDKTGKPAVSRNLKLTIAFEGTAYHGWQIQKGLPTVQGILSEILSRITDEKVNLTGSGRTDAGTHARRLIANFSTRSRIGPGQLVRAVNSMLPRDIRVLGAARVEDSFNARRDARSKVYRYQIYLGPILAPHLSREYFHYPYTVDISRMQAAARLFIGTHNFASFAKTGSESSGTVRRIFRCDLRKSGRRLHLTVEGNGFLHHMVRNMAGTLLEIGNGHITLERFRELFRKRDRTFAGFTAPAKGLVLLKVAY